MGLGFALMRTCPLNCLLSQGGNFNGGFELHRPRMHLCLRLL